MARGFVHITNCYSTKGANSLGLPISIQPVDGFRTTFTNLSMTVAAGGRPGMLINSGIVQIDNGYLWDGIQSATPIIQVFNTGVLYVTNTQFDASAGRTDTYINTSGSAWVYMSDCAFVQAPVGGCRRDKFRCSMYQFSNVRWNGWRVAVSGEQREQRRHIPGTA